MYGILALNSTLLVRVGWSMRARDVDACPIPDKVKNHTSPNINCKLAGYTHSQRGRVAEQERPDTVQPRLAHNILWTRSL